MDAHENARTTPHSRMLIVERLAAGWAGSISTSPSMTPRGSPTLR